MTFMRVLIFIWMTSLAVAEEKTFVYEDHGKKDPLAPLVANNGTVISYDTQVTVADIVLEGVMMDAKGNSIAIVNGKIVKVGDTVSSYLVEKIMVNEVVLVSGAEHLVVRMKKGGGS